MDRSAFEGSGFIHCLETALEIAPDFAEPRL